MLSTNQVGRVNFSFQCDFFSTTEPIPKAPPSGGMNWNIAGYKAELMFDVECMERGIVTCEPKALSCPFDRVTWAAGLLYKVQVKHTTNVVASGNFKVGCINNEEGVGYSKEEVDLIAARTSAGDWYLIPIAEVELKPSFTIGDSMRIFKGAWSLLKTPRHEWEKHLITKGLS